MDSRASLKNLTNDFGKLHAEQRKSLQDLVKHHIQSFDFILEDGLLEAIKNIPPQEFSDNLGRKVALTLQEASIGYPTVPDTNVHCSTLRVYPSECRCRDSTYKAKLQLTVSCSINGRQVDSQSRVTGQVPVMVKCNRCSLRNLTPKELVKHGEEAEEWGGYFIVNGKEKILRMLILPRRNYPLAIVRPSSRKRGDLFTEFVCNVRSVRRDQSAENMSLHYLSNGTCTLALFRNRETFLLPIVSVLKALVDVTDQKIYSDIVRGHSDDTFIKNCAIAMLRQAQDERLFSRREALQHIGERMRLRSELADWYSKEEIGASFIYNQVAVHLSQNIDKYNFLILCARKLLALVDGKCSPDSEDSPMNQEILLGGHFYLMVLKEKLALWLRSLRYDVVKQMTSNPDKFDLTTGTTLQRAMKSSRNVGQQLEHLLATGNLVSKSGLALKQVSGFSLLADKLNFARYLSHFRCVHRGSFFAEMRTTAVRRLLPEAWGFLCPVHTPDGAPCGLLNHLAALCEVTTDYSQVTNIPKLLVSLGMEPLSTVSAMSPSSTGSVPVVLDGRWLGNVNVDDLSDIANQLRLLKALGKEVTPMLEIGAVGRSNGGLYPGLFLFSGPARMMRPVVHLTVNAVEMIGSFEQVYMDIAVRPNEVVEGVTTHQEIHPGSMLSTIASLTPFSDFNQSPRNMYQCQMGKQTMGIPLHAYHTRMDNKLYRLQTPQSPLVRPARHDLYALDDYPLGTNAIVAVISYTGYDMEDAMILNKASVERGFAHASIYKTTLADLTKLGKRRGGCPFHFGAPRGNPSVEGLDEDGFPPVGSILVEGMNLYSYVDSTTGKVVVERYKEPEVAVVDQISLLGEDHGQGTNQRAFIKLRIQRNPIVGDKMSSRHGQKGVCSLLHPPEDMPFTESGMIPDIIFNPHGFPSRMTIGMMIESMAGKSAALHGVCYDATPFEFGEKNSAIDYFGRTLVQAGYNYYGNERLYSGVDGRELEADIFIGTVYYQRLRHMVSDKFQVRTTGPVDALTHQPVKGRRRAGGIRFGEMERDALLAHGTAFLLQDRLMNCSDRCVAQLCTKCGSLLSPSPDRLVEGPAAAAGVNSHRRWTCRLCKSAKNIQPVAIPYVFRYLNAELAAMNIRLSLSTEPL